ncbi:MAG: hypothetical protein M3P08_08715 [Thermoproteota archaeon]|nr:hypothetical protein [Thermoproteota archaeon]
MDPLKGKETKLIIKDRRGAYEACLQQVRPHTSQGLTVSVSSYETRDLMEETTQDTL